MFFFERRSLMGSTVRGPPEMFGDCDDDRSSTQSFDHPPTPLPLSSFSKDIMSVPIVVNGAAHIPYVAGLMVRAR